ncbi:MAG: 3-dehydroquinate synthase [Elusimicrobiota bacterium]
MINIDIPGHPYTVRVGEDITEFGNRLREFSRSERAVLITNDNLWPLYGDRLLAALAAASFEAAVIKLPDGEEYKKLDTVKDIYERLSSDKIERFTPVVGFGGGVVGDIAGFAASTYLRGLPFFNIPTSLIAQVDSSVGGKTGVNLECGKNLVGTFYQPDYVHIDIELLNTLDKRELVSGFAEVIKHAFIKGDEFLPYLEENMEAALELDAGVLEHIVSACVRIKGEIVIEDEKEKGLRRVLNFGHTLGHGLEASMGYGRIRHGEGIAIGMVAASEIAERVYPDKTPNLLERIRSLLIRAGLPVRIPAEADTEAVLEAMCLDKKVRHGSLEFVLPMGTGKMEPGVAVDKDLVKEVIKEIYES